MQDTLIAQRHTEITLSQKNIWSAYALQVCNLSERQRTECEMARDPVNNG